MILLSIIDLSLIKLSFLLFYSRVFIYDSKNIRSPRNLSIYLLMFIVILWGFGFSITILSACRDDFRARWISSKFEAKCINTFLMLYALAISDFVIDVLIILLPIPMIWKLHLEPSRKLGISVVFLLGSL